MPSIDTILEQQSRAKETSEIGSQTSRFMPRSEYRADAFSSDKYNVQGLTYPIDLMGSSEYGQNRVIFYINVSVDSRVLKSTTGSIEVVEGVQRSERGELIGQNFNTAQVAVGAGVVGGITGAIAQGDFDIKSIASGALKGLVVGGGTAAVAGTLVLNDQNNQESPPAEKKSPTFTRPQKRLKAAIALYTPNQLSVRYSAGWGEEETAAFAQMGAIGRALGTITDTPEILRALQNTATKTGTIAKDILTAMAIDKTPLVGAAMGIGAGLATNPKKEQAFKGIDFRTFTFEYQFAPRNEDEAINVQNIIKAFKYHMHPEFKDETGFLYIYPSEFDIVYYKGNEENLNIHRHTSCVLTEVNLNYSPNGVFSTFPNGMPTQIAMTLTFRELMPLTKELIERYA